MKKRKPEVRFVYRKSKLKLGSTTMRAHQMCRIAKAYLGDKYDFGLTNLPRRKTPSLQPIWVKLQNSGVIYIFTKSASLKINKSSLLELQKKSGGICFDYVDSNLRDIATVGVDVHIAASYSAETAMNQLLKEKVEQGLPSFGNVMPLLHNADDRLYDLSITHQDSLKSAYFGTEGYAVFTDRIRDIVDFIDAGRAQEMERNYLKLQYYNLHYCVRRVPENTNARIHKPFTKGFTAAVCRSNVIVNSSVDDAIEFLTEDYPYLVHSTNEEEILAVLKKAASTFEKHDWNKAQRIMDTVAERISPAALAIQLDAILTELAH